jgi:aspartyl-tRNA(Asn)/glutamyl-tRNA(Gln) amidotransferase subunit B
MVRDGTVSNTAAKVIFAQMVTSGEDPAIIADQEGLRQVGDDAQLIAWIDQVVAANPEEARRFLAGERKLLGVLVGLVMKASGGKADPRKVNQLLASRVGV